VPGLTLKGFTTQQMLYRPLRKQPLAMKSAASGVVGRYTEMAKIAQSAKPALIAGPAGIGKSALVRHVLHSASKGTTISGDGVQMRSSYQPFVSWINQQTGHRLPTFSDLQTTFGTLNTQALQSLALILGLPEGQRLLVEMTNVALKPMIENNIWKAIQSVMPQGMLVFEDLHWFDNASMGVLARILQDATATDHKILMTSRPDSKIACYLDDSTFTLIPLPPLDDTSAQQLLDSLQAKPSGKFDQAELLQKAAGVPLFLEQLAKWQAAEGSSGTVPSTLMDLLSEQIDATGPAKSVLQCAAVIGQKFDLGMLEVIAPEKDLIHERLLAAQAQGVVQQIDEKQWTFRHALLQQAAYMGTLRRQRVKYHAELAEHLQTHHADAVRQSPALLVDHQTRAEQHIPAIKSYMSVSQWALFQGALHDADAHIVDAIALCQQVPDDVDARALEISCQAARGAILMQMLGFAAEPVRNVYERVSELAAKQNAYSAANGPAFYGSFTHALASGNKQRAQWFAAMLGETAGHLDDPETDYDLQQAKLNVEVAYAFYTGAFNDASRLFAQMRAQYDVDRRQSMIDNYGIDGFASAQMFEAVGQAICGNPDAVDRLSAETDAHQDILNIPVMRPYALIWGGVALFLGGQRACALDRITQGIGLAEQARSTFWELTGAVWRFVFDPDLTATPEGLGAFAQNIATQEAIGAHLALPYFRAQYALAVLRSGDAATADQISQQAMNDTKKAGLQCWDAEIMRIHAAICHATGRKYLAKQLLEDATQLAARQNAKLWLLRARLDQHRLGLVGDDVLQDVIATFHTSAALPELEEARSALANT
jgi:hypothetical protein